MSVASWIIFAIVFGVTIWLLVDTIIWLVKRIKAKRNKRVINNEVDKVDK